MKETILIPIDFSVASLNILKEALRLNQATKRSYILVFEMNLGDSITDLLFLSKTMLIESCSNPTFVEGLEILKSKYSEGINSLRIEPFYGFTKASFKNFLNANQVVEAYMPPKEIVIKRHKDLKFITTQIYKLNVPTTIVEWQSDFEEKSKNTILQLFNA